MINEEIDLFVGPPALSPAVVLVPHMLGFFDVIFNQLSQLLVGAIMLLPPFLSGGEARDSISQRDSSSMQELFVLG